MEATDAPAWPGMVLTLLLLSVLSTGAAAILILTEMLVAAGVAVVAGAVGMAIAAGSARPAGPPRLRFAASVSARLADAAVLGSLTWVLLPEAPRAALAAVVGLSAAFVAAYLRVKGRGLGFRTAEWTATQPVRMAGIAVALLTPLLEAGLWVAAGVGVAEVAARAGQLAAQGEPT